MAGAFRGARPPIQRAVTPPDFFLTPRPPHPHPAPRRRWFPGKEPRLSQAIPTDIIEHALLHARQETSHCERCDKEGEIGVAELQLAMEARLMNARALIHAVRDPNKQTALMRSMATVDHLIHEAIE